MQLGLLLNLKDHEVVDDWVSRTASFQRLNHLGAAEAQPTRDLVIKYGHGWSILDVEERVRYNAYWNRALKDAPVRVARIVATVDDPPGTVMPFLDGEPLSHAITSGSLSKARAVEAVRACGTTLGIIHSELALGANDALDIVRSLKDFAPYNFLHHADSGMSLIDVDEEPRVALRHCDIAHFLFWLRRASSRRDYLGLRKAFLHGYDEVANVAIDSIPNRRRTDRQLFAAALAGSRRLARRRRPLRALRMVGWAVQYGWSATFALPSSGHLRRPVSVPFTSRSRVTRKSERAERTSAGVGSRVGVFMWDLRGLYADQFIIRQAESLGASPIRAVHVSTELGPEIGAPLGSPFFTWMVAGERRARRLLGLSSGKHSRSLIVSLALSRWIEREELGVIYCMFLGNGLQALDAVRRVRKRRPLRFVIHGAGYDVSGLLAKEGTSKVADLQDLIEAADVVTCGSKYLCKILESAVKGSNPRLHYLGVDKRYFYDLPVRSSDSFIRFISVSRLAAIKGVDLALRSVHRLRQQGCANIWYDIIGDGPLRGDLEILARQLGMDDVVTFHGSLPSHEVISMLDASDVFLQHNVPLASGAEEAIGGSLIEASARGLPVVATDSGGTTEAILDGETGLLVRPGDVDGMADALALLATDPRLRMEMGKAGREFVEMLHYGPQQDARFARMVRESREVVVGAGEQKS